jgi:hypothetical protein
MLHVHLNSFSTSAPLTLFALTCILACSLLATQIWQDPSCCGCFLWTTKSFTYLSACSNSFSEKTTPLLYLKFGSTLFLKTPAFIWFFSLTRFFTYYVIHLIIMFNYSQLYWNLLFIRTGVWFNPLHNHFCHIIRTQQYLLNLRWMKYS